MPFTAPFCLHRGLPFRSSAAMAATDSRERRSPSDTTLQREKMGGRGANERAEVAACCLARRLSCSSRAHPHAALEGKSTRLERAHRREHTLSTALNFDERGANLPQTLRPQPRTLPLLFARRQGEGRGDGAGEGRRRRSRRGEGDQGRGIALRILMQCRAAQSRAQHSTEHRKMHEHDLRSINSVLLHTATYAVSSPVQLATPTRSVRGLSTVDVGVDGCAIRPCPSPSLPPPPPPPLCLCLSHDDDGYRPALLLLVSEDMFGASNHPLRLLMCGRRSHSV